MATHTTHGDPVSSPEISAGNRLWSTARRLITPFLLIVASIAFVAANVPAHNQVSPYDEYVYIDYLAKFPQQGVVATGEETGEFARNYIACHGVAGYGLFNPESCDTSNHTDDEAYPFNGKTSADLYTPLYFGITWVAAQPFLWFSDMDLVEAGRMAGWIWLASGSVLLFYALRRLQVSHLAAGASSLLLIASVPAWWSATFISTDGSAFTAGAALLFLGVRYAQTARGGWLLTLVSALAVALKLQNYMAVVAVAIFLLLQRLGKAREEHNSAFDSPQQTISGGRLVTTVGGMLLVPIIVQGLWVLIRNAISVSEFPDQLVAVPFTFESVIIESLKFFGQIGLASTVPEASTVAWTLAMIATWLMVAGILGTIAVEQRFGIRYSLALATLVTMLLAGPALALVNLVFQGFYFPLPTRYGLSLLPFALALAATLFDKKRETRIALLLIAGVTFAASLTPYFPGIEM